MAKDTIATDGSRYHVPNLERALKVMEHLSDHPTGQTVSQIMSALGYPKNSVFRITMTLLNHGYLMRDEETKQLRLTRKLLAVGYAAVGEVNIVEMALEFMRELRDVTHETVLLGTILGTEGVIMERLIGHHSFSFTAIVGTRFNLHTSAPGKAILANLSPTERDQIVGSLHLQRFNERTITTRKQLLQELDAACRDGYACDRSEEFENCHCVAAPIFDQHGYPIASIWATGPADRFPLDSFEETGEIVKSHAMRLSRRLGYGLLD